MHETSPKAEDLFFAALELPDSAARSAFLDECCSDPVLRRQVEELLACDARSSKFLEDLPSSLRIGGTNDLEASIEQPGAVIGPYKLLEVLGEGGMGVVYMADQVRPVRRRVALKVVKPGMDSKQVVARFEAERQALALMDHPNIAKVHDGGMTPSGRPYFVMELVRGLPITDYCDREQLSIPERLDLFVLVCRAVQHAHQKGVIHRDLKPSNVLVTVIDGVAVPKVIDFGVAKATGLALTDRSLFTGFHQFVGTPLYTSPEQADLSGVDVDTRSDVYSLGVLLYELLTGTTPFDPEALKRAAFDEMRRIIREEEPPRPSTRLSSLGEQRRSTVSADRKAAPGRLKTSIVGELDWVVMKALEKDRRRRYETANDFAADLQRYLADQPVEAFPPSVAYRFRKFARRNRTALAFGVLILLSLTTDAAVSAWLAVRAVRAERRAEARSAQARQAVDEMYTQVAEQWLAQQPKLTPIQAEVLEKAMGFYERFAAEESDDPVSLFEAARARNRVGMIQRAMGRFDQAADAFRRSVAQLETLMGRFPKRGEYSSELAEVCINLGGLEVELGYLDRAEPLFERGLPALEAMAARDPNNPKNSARLANILTALGELQSRRKRYLAAEPLLRRALDFFEQLDGEDSLPKDHLFRFAACENELGILCEQRNRLPEAEQFFLNAIRRLEKRSGDGGAAPRQRSLLAVVLTNLASVHFKTGRSSEGRANELRSIAMLEALIVDYPETLGHRDTLLAVLRNVLQSTVEEQPGEAETIARKAVDLGEGLVRDHPEIREYREQLAIAGPARTYR